MQTNFTLAQLADPALEDAEKVIRTCVHCGFCLATCPTYVLSGDERDSPRGRIYLIKEIMEKGRSATSIFTQHIDRCLSCFSCMTTCPSGVNYRMLVDHARGHIERTYRRPKFDTFFRWWLAKVLVKPDVFRFMLACARLLQFLKGPIPDSWFPSNIKAMLDRVPRSSYPKSSFEGSVVIPAVGEYRGRVALLAGCVQNVLAPQINDATVRVLSRHGIEVHVVTGTGCCGALAHHLGREQEARKQAEQNIRAWMEADKETEFDAILINASGCGDMIKNYGSLFRYSPNGYSDLENSIARVMILGKDVTEYLYEIGIEEDPEFVGPSVAYHGACALRHGQGVHQQPCDLLGQAGFDVTVVPDGHMCCGSAGTYSLVQPKLAGRLAVRKALAIDQTGADLVATGNIGCLIQIGQATEVPVVHTVELIDWATGGPKPTSLGGEN